MARSSKYRIRPARNSDCKAILALQDCAFPDDPIALTASSVSEKLSENSTAIQVAELNGKLVGYIVSTDRKFRPWTGTDFVAVDEKHRGKGLGKRLMLASMTAARRPIFRLFVRPSNDHARRLYNNLGFHHVSTRKAHYHDDGEDAWILMRLRFNSEFSAPKQSAAGRSPAVPTD